MIGNPFFLIYIYHVQLTAWDAINILNMKRNEPIRAETLMDDISALCAAVLRDMGLPVDRCERAADSLTDSIIKRWGGEMAYISKRPAIRARQQSLCECYALHRRHMSNTEALRAAAGAAGYTVSHAQKIIKQFEVMTCG